MFANNLTLELKACYSDLSKLEISDLFAQDPSRTKKFSALLPHMMLDYSKHLIDTKVFNLLLEHACSCSLDREINNLFAGKYVSASENRLILHTAYRQLANGDDNSLIREKSVLEHVQQILVQMEGFSERVRQGKLLGYTNKPIRHIVNIGMGGSSIGPQLVCEALQSLHCDDLTVTFLQDLDPEYLRVLLSSLDFEQTLFIVSSKSFTTSETLLNAKLMASQYPKKSAIKKHFVAITNNLQAAKEFGAAADYTFYVPDSVTGRYSVWSAIGLPVAIMIGFDKFKELLEGGHEVDQYFLNTSFESNAIVKLALLSVWYRNVASITTQAILPYTSLLNKLPLYLQQLVMESNGKCLTRHQNSLTEQASSIIWGNNGLQGQHAFFQALHQTHHVVPLDFIMVKHNMSENLSFLQDGEDLLFASGAIQAHVLMNGASSQEIYSACLKEGYDDSIAAKKSRYLATTGGKPSTTIVLLSLSPASLGALMALYEHKTFVEGVVLNINSFDQFGVEVGKDKLKEVLPYFSKKIVPDSLDPSTKQIIEFYYDRASE